MITEFVFRFPGHWLRRSALLPTGVTAPPSRESFPQKSSCQNILGTSDRRTVATDSCIFARMASNISIDEQTLSLWLQRLAIASGKMRVIAHAPHCNGCKVDHDATRAMHFIDDVGRALAKLLGHEQHHFGTPESQVETKPIRTIKEGEAREQVD